MCDHSSQIKFCTCGIVPDHAENCWSLSIVNPRFPSKTLIEEGVWNLRPVPSASETIIQQALVDALNNPDSFDFEYVPKNGDMMSISIDTSDFEFIVENGRFVEDKRNAFDGTNTVTIAEGKLDIMDSNGASLLPKVHTA